MRRKPIPPASKPGAETSLGKGITAQAAARRSGVGRGTTRDATMAEYEECATVYVQMWGTPQYRQGPLGDRVLEKIVRERPHVIHNGQKVHFANIPLARAWALENGYVGIRVEFV